MEVGWKPEGTFSMVAPELRPNLETFPTLELTDELLAFMRSEAGKEMARPPPSLTSAEQAVRCEEARAPGLGGAPDVRMLVYTPPGEAVAERPGYLHIHGGGYIGGMPEMCDKDNRALVVALGCVVVSVDYRLAPETRWPGSLEDCYAGLLWLHAHAAELRVDPARIAIGGESAGGGHAAAVALYARDRGEAPICLQMLDSPMLDDRTGSGSEPHPCCGEFIWTPASNRFGWRALLGVDAGGVDVREAAVPARAKDLSGLPPTFILVGALDLFCEESLEYARRLVRAGVPTELHVLPGAYHGFQLAGPHAPQVNRALELRDAALSRAWA